MATRLVLIRHARTDTGSRLCGSFDIPLTAAGHAHVRAVLGRPLSRPVPDVLYTSTLTRAREVATPLGRVWALEPRLADWAREIHCGHVEGMPLERLERRFPALWSRNQAQNDDTFAWPGGETYAQFRARVLAGLATAAAAHPGGRVAIVTHAGVISQVLGVIQGRPACVWAMNRPEPLTATEVTWERDMPGALLTYNDPYWY